MPQPLYEVAHGVRDLPNSLLLYAISIAKDNAGCIAKGCVFANAMKYAIDVNEKGRQSAGIFIAEQIG